MRALSARKRIPSARGRSRRRTKGGTRRELAAGGAGVRSAKPQRKRAFEYPPASHRPTTRNSALPLGRIASGGCRRSDSVRVGIRRGRDVGRTGLRNRAPGPTVSRLSARRRGSDAVRVRKPTLPPGGFPHLRVRASRIVRIVAPGGQVGLYAVLGAFFSCRLPASWTPRALRTAHGSATPLGNRQPAASDFRYRGFAIAPTAAPVWVRTEKWESTGAPLLSPSLPPGLLRLRCRLRLSIALSRGRMRRPYTAAKRMQAAQRLEIT